MPPRGAPGAATHARAAAGTPPVQLQAALGLLLHRHSRILHAAFSNLHPALRDPAGRMRRDPGLGLRATARTVEGGTIPNTEARL